MSKANFCFAFLFGDFENNFCAYPFGFISRELEVVVRNEPNYLLCWNKLNDLHFALVNILIGICKFTSKLVCAPLYIFSPPSTDIIDGGKSFLRRLVYQDGGCEILIFHDCRIEFFHSGM